MTAKEKEAFNVSRVLFELESHHLELLNKWTKISDLETTIFELNMMVKSGLGFVLFLNSTSPFRVTC